MTLRDDLKKQLEKDYQRAPPKFFNSTGLEMTWNKSENLYTAVDSKGKEWIASLQDTKVPIFSIPCTNKTEGDKVNCGAINFVPICNSDDMACRKCGKNFPVQLNIPESSIAYKILEKLDN